MELSVVIGRKVFRFSIGTTPPVSNGRWAEKIMSKDLISKKTRTEFREYFVGTSLREIEAEFDAADVPLDQAYEPPTTGQRRSLVEQYYHAVDWSNWHDVRRVLTVYENVLSDLENRSESNATFGYSNSEWAREKFASLKKWIERDGYKFEDGKLTPIGKSIDLTDIQKHAEGFDIPELQRQIARIIESVDEDPSLAIGTAKELIETTCKTILSDHGIESDDSLDITKLVKETRKHLGLVPESIPSAAKGAEVIQRILSNLGTIAQGLSELRNLYGTGHGKHGKSKGLSPRHARLAVGAAATLAMFLLETHQDRAL